jgi:GR25 family glycosyltransferase involved in LPS biosynthesis
MNTVDHIFVINLEKRKDRLTYFMDQCEKNGIKDSVEVFEAVDGTKLKPTKEIKELFRNNKFRYRAGICGCAMSHYNLWKKIGGFPPKSRTIVFEDDAELCPDFVKKWNEIADKIPDDCYFLYLNINNGNKKQTFVTKQNDHFTNHFSGGHGTFAYMITPEIAGELIQYCNKNGMQDAIDWMIMNMFKGIKTVSQKEYKINDYRGYRLIEHLVTHSTTVGKESNVRGKNTNGSILDN